MSMRGSRRWGWGVVFLFLTASLYAVEPEAYRERLSRLQACARSMLGIPESTDPLTFLSSPSLSAYPYLAGHAFADEARRVPVLPGALSLKLGFEILSLMDTAETHSVLMIDGLRVSQFTPLVDADSHSSDVRIQTEIAPTRPEGNFRIKLILPLSNSERLAQGTGRILSALPEIPPSLTEGIHAGTTLAGADLYEKLSLSGLAYGSSFRGVTSAEVAGNRAEADIMLPSGSLPSSRTLDDAVVDSCLHLLGAIFFAGNPGVRAERVAVPTAFGKSYFAPANFTPHSRQFRCHVEADHVPTPESTQVKFKLHLSNLSGATILYIEGGVAKAVDITNAVIPSLFPNAP